MIGGFLSGLSNGSNPDREPENDQSSIPDRLEVIPVVGLSLQAICQAWLMMLPVVAIDVNAGVMDAEVAYLEDTCIGTYDD